MQPKTHLVMAHKQLIAYSLLLQVCQSDPAGGAGRRLRGGGGGQGPQRHRGPHAGLHERPRHDLLHVRPHDAHEVVSSNKSRKLEGSCPNPLFGGGLTGSVHLSCDKAHVDLQMKR